MSSAQDRQLLDLLRQNDWPGAEALARVILQDRPGDVGTLVVLSRALRAQGDAAGAKVAAERAEAASRNPREHYISAVELAAASYDLGHPMSAQLWLRRAVQMAPDEALKARSLRDLRAVMAATPWEISFDLNAGPSSNVNNGSLADQVDIGGIDFILNPDARALSGYEIAAQLGLRYRFKGFGDLPAQAGLTLFTQQVVLSDKAKRAVPDAKGSDYAFSAVELSLGQALNKPSDPLRFRLDGVIGKNWYGGADLSNYLRLSGAAQWGDAQRAVTTLTLTGERQIRLDDPRKTASILALSARRDWRLRSGDRLGLSLGVRKARSDSIEIDHRAVIVGLSYDLGRPLAGKLSLGAGFQFERRDYDASLYATGARRDWRRQVSLRIGFPKLDYYGFSPVLRIEAEKTNSNVEYYKRYDTTVRFGLRSVF
ncbi:surface lipoprotein assembly modifier [Thioclava pacifica]|uniref:surface lipoprotein assembly modifier n=1 Tax=Thioclava pacifica TaxID=285109 RepID=UPI000AA62D37|nr:surface lipoprotein assembly modifier [Thioclava pacifica]